MSVYRTEEEQIELIKAFWNKYQQVIGSVVLIGLICFAGYSYWQRHVMQLQTQAASLYEAAMAAVGNQDVVKTRAFSNRILEIYPHSAYGDFARLLMAKGLVDEGKLQQAIPPLETVAKQGYSPFIRQVAEARLARVRGV